MKLIETACCALLDYPAVLLLLFGLYTHEFFASCRDRALEVPHAILFVSMPDFFLFSLSILFSFVRAIAHGDPTNPAESPLA